tara:strand:+ start:840 stop:2648 length:1809 start_codon:yes stop_codon:yes gene_type:complete
MNFLISTLCLLGFYNIALNFNAFYYKTKTNIIQNIFTFTLIFYVIYIIISYFFLFEINSKSISIGIAAFTFLSGFNFILREYKSILENINTKFNYKLLLLSIISYYFISYLIPSDQDSLRYHLEIPKKIIENTFYLNTTFDYMVIGSNEFINLFGLHLNFENTGSLLSFAYIIFIFLANIYFFERYQVGSRYLGGIIVVSSPYLVALIASQKIYLLPCFIVSYAIAYLYIAKKEIIFKDIIIIITLGIFAFCLKSIFLPYLIYILCWSLFIYKSNKIEKIYIGLFTFIAMCISYFPIAFIKYEIYKDPFLPILNINPENREWFGMFKYYLTNFQMDYTDNLNQFFKVFLTPIKLIVPLTIGDFFKTLGAGMLGLLMLPYKNNKNLLLIVLFFIFSFAILQNYQSRWIFPLLIFIGIFLPEIDNNWFKKIIYFQFVLVLLVSVPLAFSVLANNLMPRLNINQKIFPIKNILGEVNSKYKNERYFSNFNYFYYQDNKVPIYYPKITSIFDKDFFNRNAGIKLFLYDGPSQKFSQFMHRGKFDFKLSKQELIDLEENPDLERQEKAKGRATCSNSEYELLEEWEYNSRRFFFISSIRNLYLYRLC